MTFLEVLQFLHDNHFPMLLWPTLKTGGCVSSMQYDVVAEHLSREGQRAKAESGERFFFVEVVRNKGGDISAMIYLYPRPPELTSDVTWSVDKPSPMPLEFLDARYHDDEDTTRWPHECIGLQRSGFEQDYAQLAASGLPPKVYAGSSRLHPADVLAGDFTEGRKPKADPMAKRTPGIPGPSACHEPFGT
jgi:hypothetical protein